MAHFLDIPPELIVHILCYLSLPDLASVSRTHSIVHTCITSSSFLQYRFAAGAAGVKNNPLSNHSILERLTLLKSSEDGWAQFQFDFQQTIAVEPGLLALRYDTTSGIFFCTDVERKNLHYCKLPSKATDIPTWANIYVGSIVLEIGFSIHEHDLIAVLTTRPCRTAAGHHIVEVRLLQFSTGNSHPLADNPVLFIRELSEARVPTHCCVEISGYNLALSTSPNFLKDSLYIYNWKNTSLRLKTLDSFNVFFSLIFLSPDYILLPRTSTGSLDIWALEGLDPLSTHRKPALSLALPRMSSRYSMIELSCNTNATGFARTPYSPRPFHTVSEKRIIMLDTILATGETTRCSFVVHPKALLDLVRGGANGLLLWPSWGPSITRCFEQPENVNIWKMISAGQRGLALTRRTTGPPDAQGLELRLLDFNQTTVKKLLKEQNHSYYLADEICTKPVPSRPKFVVRLAKRTKRLVENFSHLLKLDPKSGRDTTRRNAPQEEQNPPFVVAERTCLKRHPFAGEVPVETMLPYVSIPCRLEGVPCGFDGIVMDEERLVTIWRGDGGRLAELRMLHIGASDCQAD